jgi:ubiquinone/menaquinone biosynthesis C-methylase UbiE
MGRGKVYPASAARHLVNPLRNLVQPPGRLVRWMNLGTADVVLEVGCGPGWFTSALVRAVPDGRVVSCDLQPDMARLAVGRVGERGLVHAAVADAQALPFPDETFDTSLLATVLGEVPNPLACLCEIRRVLVPGGSLIVAETRRDSDFIGQTALKEMTLRAGFSKPAFAGPRWEYRARLTRP